MTTIKQLGGEFALIHAITQTCKNRDVIVGIGDDAAVINIHGKNYAITTDMFIEETHFSFHWSSFYDVGWKVVQGAVSDICAMGGRPLYLTMAGSFKKENIVEEIKLFSDGMYAAAASLNIDIIGGDTTKGKFCCFCATVVGSVEQPCLRSAAEVNDFILLSGNVGRSASGLAMLQAGYSQNKEKNNQDIEYHKRPVCAGLFGEKIAPHIHAMIDVSDGVASEIKHICKQSNVGAVIEKEKLPLHSCTIKNAKLLNRDPYQWVLSGGEDYVLLFTVTPDAYKKNKSLFNDCTVIGKILPLNDGIFLLDKNQKMELPFGYDHFH